MAREEDEGLEKVFTGFTPGRTAVTYAPVDVLSLPLADGEHAEITSYTPSAITLATRTSGNRLIVINNIYDAGWKAWVDGKRAEVMRVNYAFLGVVVPQGEHEVTVRFAGILY